MKSNNYMTTKYFGRLLGLLLILFAGFTSCEDNSDLELNLAVNSNKVIVKDLGGSTHIMIYSTGDWDAKLETPVGWASIDKLSEKGNNSVLFSCARNYGAARKINIIVTKGDERQEIQVIQEGINPALNFPVNKFSLAKTLLPTAIPLTTNLEHNLDEIEIDILYDDETSEKWISEVKVTTEALEFVALENTLGEFRSARVHLKFVDGLDKTVSTFVDLGQTLDNAFVSFEEPETLLSKLGASAIANLESNMLTSLKFMEQTIEYSGTSKDWITELEFKDKTMLFEVDDNKTGADRDAKITLSLKVEGGSQYTLEHKVIQQISDHSIYSFDQIRALIPATSGERLITSGIMALQGIVINDVGNPNMETNPNTAFNKINWEVNDKTAYMQALDGKYGIRLQTTEVSDNKFAQYSKTIISLSGLTLVKEANPERYTLKGITAAHIADVETGNASNLVAKNKAISDLTNDDIYTYVTLKDTEISIPHGSFVNANTGYFVQTQWNPTGMANAAYKDTYPMSIRDNKGGDMYMLTNGRTSWMKDKMPKGSGSISGVIVNTLLLKYGTENGNIGKYSIRPLTKNDIALNNAALSKTLVEWNWLGGGENVAVIGAIQKDGQGNVLPAIGNGKLSCTASTASGLGGHFINFPNPDDKGGINSALHYTAKWWNTTINQGEAFVFNFSTAGISGSNFTVNFTQGAGSGTAATMHHPTYWQVEYSTDGVNYTALPNSTYVVRPLGWWGGQLAFTPLGLIDHSFQLPSSLLGKANVYVKLKAKSNACATTTGSENGTITDANAAVNVRVGIVSFKYN